MSTIEIPACIAHEVKPWHTWGEKILLRCVNCGALFTATHDDEPETYIEAAGGE